MSIVGESQYGSLGRDGNGEGSKHSQTQSSTLDPRFPYANLLHPGPGVGVQSPQIAGTSSYSSQQTYSTTDLTPTPTSISALHPDNTHANAQAARAAARSTHRSHPYQHPSKAEILRRHSASQSYWDDPSPGNSTDDSKPNHPQSTGGGKATPTSGRSGQKRRQKYTRTRTGCLCCRARRIKCDEARPVCKRCVIAKKTCQYPDCGEESKGGRSGKGSKHSGSDESEESEDDGRQKSSRRTSDASKDRNSGSPPDHVGQNGQRNDLGWDASYVGDQGYQGSTLGMGLGTSTATASGSSGVNGQSWSLSTETGKQEWSAEQGGTPMLSTPNFLLPWFPTVEERSLILHYCANAASLMMAIPSGLNPMLAINLPLALDSPRGMNPSADALRVALLGIGAIHQAFLLARSGVATSQTAAMFQYASTLRDTGKEMVRRAVAAGPGVFSDAALGAGTALATIDIFFGGAGWKENFKLAKDMVALRGGPAEMLKNSTPTKLTEGVTVSPARLMLEILAIYETFGCLTTGEEPTLISDRWESWWLEASRSTYEEHSVEKQFGMSRVMVLLFARLTRLISRVAKSPVLITESDSPLPLPSSASTPGTGIESGFTPTTGNLLPSLNGSVIPTSRSTSTPLSTFGEDPLVTEARQLNKDVNAWIDSLQLSTLEHERVQVGNRAYAHAMKILLLRMVFKYPREDARVQSAAQQVLQHCSWSTAALGMSIDLTWPAIIAGCCVDGASRQWLLTLLEGFKAQCCFDIETATRIITEVWRRVDAGEPRADWKYVCDDLGLQVL
ncbi:hypothetical protein CI109_100261 [Kwoniella shandongensis]|uniref:Zn(2)-C6 fungal-type domain-containing protein n=1 Tax=Kwoniella shandongensis TaxID=1734106 RepID=A0AAJ8MUH7_9TREE